MKFEQVTQETPESFSDWTQPIMEAYKMACCDCGLVHDMEFRVVRVVKDFGDGTKKIQAVENPKLTVQFRARRNNRSTGQVRRHKK